MLLDTHVWVWLNVDPSKLSDTMRGHLLDPQIQFSISAITIWEVVVAVQRGRLAATLPVEKLVAKWQRVFPLTVLPIDETEAVLSRTLEFEHNDPADRFIAATAYRHELPLATADRRLAGLTWLKIVKPD